MKSFSSSKFLYDSKAMHVIQLMLIYTALSYNREQLPFSSFPLSISIWTLMLSQCLDILKLNYSWYLKFNRIMGVLVGCIGGASLSVGFVHLAPAATRLIAIPLLVVALVIWAWTTRHARSDHENNYALGLLLVGLFILSMAVFVGGGTSLLLSWTGS